MPKKGFSAEQIVTLLGHIEVSMAQGNTTQWTLQIGVIDVPSRLVGN